MDYRLTGEHMPGEIGEWRFDKRTYHDKPPPRNLGQPPANMKNELVLLSCSSHAPWARHLCLPGIPAADVTSCSEHNPGRHLLAQCPTHRRQPTLVPLCRCCT